MSSYGPLADDRMLFRDAGPRELFPNVEYRPVCVNQRSRTLNSNISLESLRRVDPLGDSVRRPGSMTENAQDALTAIVIFDSQDGVSIGRLKLVANIVNH